MNVVNSAQKSGTAGASGLLQQWLLVRSPCFASLPELDGPSAALTTNYDIYIYIYILFSREMST